MRSGLKGAPAKVREAVLGGDIAAHMAMSSAGGRKAAANRELSAIYKDWPGKSIGQLSEEDRRKQAGEDILPPDSIN